MNSKVRMVLVGIFFLLGVAVAVLGYYWFSGRLGDRYQRTVTVYFNEVSGLKPGDRVDVLGITRGKVLTTELVKDNQVKVRVALAKDVPLYKNARFAIRSLSYLGSDRYLMVNPGSGEPAGDTVVFYGRNEVLDLESTFLKLDRLMAQIDPESLTAELRQTRGEILALVNSRLRSLDTGFSATSRNIERLAALVDSLTRMFDRKSTAGKLLTSSELYDELLKASRDLQGLILDIRNRPERYFRLFK
ncbi:MAG: MlaD family protein [candidate division WOR-3 bacterium]|jgi:ABC-type transporter Mla subunit MlaD